MTEKMICHGRGIRDTLRLCYAALSRSRFQECGLKGSLVSVIRGMPGPLNLPVLGSRQVCSSIFAALHVLPSTKDEGNYFTSLFLRYCNIDCGRAPGHCLGAALSVVHCFTTLSLSLDAETPRESAWLRLPPSRLDHSDTFNTFF